jgi:hypothetical protein
LLCGRSGMGTDVVAREMKPRKRRQAVTHAEAWLLWVDVRYGTIR